MNVRSIRRLLAALPLYAALATAVGFSDYHVRTYPDLGYTDYVPSVVSGRADPPGRYRVLAPYLTNWLSEISPFSPVTDWLLFRWFCLFLSLLVLHVYLRTWFDDGVTVLGGSLAMALIPLTFTNSWPNPDQFTELALFTAACACVARGWWGGFLVALVANAFNRETSAFLVLLYFASAPFSWPHLVQTALAGLIWTGITIGLRVELGFIPYDPWQFWQNLGWLTPLPEGFGGYKRIFGWFFLVLLVPLGILASRRWRDLPRYSRAATGVVAPAFFVVGFLFSSTIESRIFTPLLPLLLPAVLFALTGRSGDADAASHEAPSR